MAKKITVIEPIRNDIRVMRKKKLRVCAYVRVSTGSDAQANSFITMITYYTELIENNPEWEFVGIYADEAVTGTKVDKREEFQTMMQECEDGNIDLIITKTVTRFGRNTVETLRAIRRLKDLGIGVYFESQNINTLSEKSEMLLTILSSVAQGESEDFSGNNKWAVVKRFEDGTFTLSVPAYGYTKDENGEPIIEPKEAEVVRLIYQLYLNGYGLLKIAQKLNEDGIETIRDSEQWNKTTVKGILTNPMYVGDFLQQKTITTDTFPSTRKKNKGEANQYLISDNHPPIVTREQAQAVREIMEYHAGIVKADKNREQKRYTFSGKILCKECGANLRRQKVYIGKPYERIIWTCSTHVQNIEKCQMKAIREDELQNAFVAMWNKLYTNQGVVLEPLLEGLKQIPYSKEDTEELEQLDNEIRELMEQCRIQTQVMEKGYMDAALFYAEQNRLICKLSECRKRKNMLLIRKKGRKEIVKTEQLIGLLRTQEHLLKEFDDELFDMTVHHIEITKEHDIIFCLHNGLRLKEENKIVERS